MNFPCRRGINTVINRIPLYRFKSGGDIGPLQASVAIHVFLEAAFQFGKQLAAALGG